MPNIDRAIERIYEEPGYRDELRDPEADILLLWAEDQVAYLGESAADQFDAKLELFFSLLKALNRCAGRRGTLDTAEMGTKMLELRTLAMQLGVYITNEQASAFLEQVGAMDDAAAVTHLTELFSLNVSE